MILRTKTLLISAGHTEAGIVLAFRDAVADELRGKVVFAKDGWRGQIAR